MSPELRQLDAGSPPGAVGFLARGPLGMSLETEAPGPAMLVLSEISYPGWRARVDGAEATVWRVNYILRGVALAPGRHRVELFYRPPAVPRGAAISVAAALSLGLMVWLDRRRAQREREPARSLLSREVVGAVKACAARRLRLLLIRVARLARLRRLPGRLLHFFAGAGDLDVRLELPVITVAHEEPDLDARPFLEDQFVVAGGVGREPVLPSMFSR